MDNNYLYTLMSLALDIISYFYEILANLTLDLSFIMTEPISINAPTI